MGRQEVCCRSWCQLLMLRLEYVSLALLTYFMEGS
jgi:hypothetical protein